MTDANTDHDLSGKIRDGIDSAKERATHAYESAREKAEHAVDASRDKARETARQTAQTIETNPLGVIVGGLALGALVAAVLPRSQREKALLAPVGSKVAAAAAAAFAAAKETGRSELADLGISRDAAKGQAKSLVDNLLKAATSAGTAAAQAGKDQVKAR